MRSLRQDLGALTRTRSVEIVQSPTLDITLSTLWTLPTLRLAYQSLERLPRYEVRLAIEFLPPAGLPQYSTIGRTFFPRL